MKSDETADIFQEKDFGVSPSTDGTSYTRCGENFSLFGDGSCGEPLFAQHVTLDFTPNDDIDNDFVQKKVCSFWNFIHNTPVIQNLKVKAEKNPFASTSNLTPETRSTKSHLSSESKYKVDVDPLDTAAVDMLESIEEKGMLGHTLGAKLPQSKCTLGSREYKETDAFTFTRPKKREKKKAVCTCIIPCHPDCTKHVKPSPDPPSPIRMLNKKLKEWDAKHPKSMEPPGHPPPLHHCVFQRQVYP